MVMSTITQAVERERNDGTEFSVLSQSRQSSSEETRDPICSHPETRMPAGRECAEYITVKHQAMKRKHHQDSETCSPSACSSTICTLASIRGVPALLEEIQYSCDVLKQVQLEVWHVVNLHVLRVFSSLSREQRDTADDLLKIDQSFFYSCCLAPLQSTEERDRQEREQRGHSRLEVKHPELYRTIADIWEEHRQVSSYMPMEIFVHGGASLNETAALMAINAANATAQLSKALVPVHSLPVCA